MSGTFSVRIKFSSPQFVMKKKKEGSRVSVFFFFNKVKHNGGFSGRRRAEKALRVFLFLFFFSFNVSHVFYFTSPLLSLSLLPPSHIPRLRQKNTPSNILARHLGVPKVLEAHPRADGPHPRHDGGRQRQQRRVVADDGQRRVVLELGRRVRRLAHVPRPAPHAHAAAHADHEDGPRGQQDGPAPALRLGVVPAGSSSSSNVVVVVIAGVVAIVVVVVVVVVAAAAADVYACCCPWPSSVR